MTTSDTGPYTCANCFAEFEWTPFTQDGEDFCCSGCAEGGPCICTYEGAPHLQDEAQSGVVAVAGTSDGESAPGEVDEAEQDDEVPAASTGDSGAGNEPPEEPPAPEQTPEGGDDDGDVPTNGRLAVIMGAVAEMPLPVQEVVQARLSNPGAEEEIGEPLGLTGDEVRQLLEQGQRILDRTLGGGFRIRYIAAEQISAEGPPEPEFPPMDTEEGPGPTEDRASDLGEMIARSVDSLTRAAAVEGPDQEVATHVLADTLREAGELFRQASERLGGAGGPATSPPQFRQSPQTEPEREIESVTLIVDNAVDVGLFFVGLQAIDSVVSARLEQVSPSRAVFGLRIGSLMGLVRGLMGMAEGLRPSRLQMADGEITMEMPPAARPPTAMTGVQPVPADTRGQQFELVVDSFFGARHFVASENTQGAPHHHSYRVEASFITSQPDRYGFVVGFARVRELVDTTVMDYSETLLNTEDPFREIPPTTENLARVFHRKVSEKLTSLNMRDVRLRKIRVWESPTNSATYSEFGPGLESDAAASA